MISQIAEEAEPAKTFAMILARDVRVGRDGGARVVGVATGTDSVESLRAAGADVVLPDLGDTRAVAEAVTSLAG